MFDPANVNKKKEKRVAIQRVSQWVRQKLPPNFRQLAANPQQLRIDVREIVCGDPACSPIDTVVSFVFDNAIRGEIGFPFEVDHMQPADLEEEGRCRRRRSSRTGAGAGRRPGRPRRRSDDEPAVMGQAVECCVGKGVWQPGTVVALWYSEAGFPPGFFAPYQIETDDGGSSSRGGPDRCVRARRRAGGPGPQVEVAREATGVSVSHDARGQQNFPPGRAAMDGLQSTLRRRRRGPATALALKRSTARRGLRVRTWVLRSSLLVLAVFLVSITMVGSEARRRLGGDDDDDGCCSGSDKVRADPRWLVVFYIGGITHMFLAPRSSATSTSCPPSRRWPRTCTCPRHGRRDPDGRGRLRAGALHAARRDVQAVRLGLRTIVGSAVFNILFVIGVCASAAPAPLVLTWWPLLRDCTYYAIALGALTFFFANSDPAVIHWYESLILFLMYFGYLAVMAQNKNLHYAFMKRVMGKSDAERSRAASAGVFTILTERKTVFEMAGIAAVTRIVGDANETFDGIDADASGKIDRDELEAFLRKEGCCDEQLSPEAMAKPPRTWTATATARSRARPLSSGTRPARPRSSRRRGAAGTCSISTATAADASEVAHVLKQMSGDDDVDEDGALKAIAEIKDGARASGVETAGIELTDKGAPLPASTDTVGFDEFKAWFATSEFFQAKSSQTKAVVEAAGDEEDGEGLSLSWPADASPSGKFFFAARSRSWRSSRAP
ncbi:calcium, potassium:sodium antiporter [Aureococcus anophagefferens]|nr:calcium, potassium:sodium antiporter [Aureococcus anophagefferens]